MAFSRNQKIQRQESHSIGMRGHWGITHSPYSRPLLTANALTHTPYSWQLLIGPLEPLLLNYCSKIQNPLELRLVWHLIP